MVFFLFKNLDVDKLKQKNSLIVNTFFFYCWSLFNKNTIDNTMNGWQRRNKDFFRKVAGLCQTQGRAS